MENILSQAKKIAEAVEVFTVSSEETTAQFEANRLKHVNSTQTTSLALRIIKDGKIGYASASGVSDAKSLVDSAVEAARFGMPASFEFPPLNSYPEVNIFDSGVKSISIEEMAALGEKMIETVTGYNEEIICEGGAGKGIVSVRIINSNGGEAEYKKSIFSLGIHGSLIRSTDMLFVGESDSSCHPIKETKQVTDEVLKQLELAKNQAPVLTKKLPVIFTPNGVASSLIPSLTAAFNGKIVLEGASPIGNKLGKAVFDSKLSLHDDPTIAYRPNSRPTDDEGVASQRTPLIEEGVVKSFFYDIQTAALAKTKSTGNGSRSGGMPTPTPSAFIIEAGDTNFEDMVSDIKEGLLIEHLMGAEQGNVLGGDFSGNVLLGYKVESGKIVGRVKNTMVSGNIYQVLKEVAAIGSKPKWVGGFLQTPHIYCPGLSVASK